MNWEERKQEIIKMYDNYCMNDFFTKIVTQEQAIIEQLEADKAELLEALKDIPCTCMDAYKDRGLTAPDCPRCNYVDLDLIEKMEVK